MILNLEKRVKELIWEVPSGWEKNYFTWLNNYGFFPKVTEVEIEYVFDNVKSVENLEVQVGVVRG